MIFHFLVFSVTQTKNDTFDKKMTDLVFTDLLLYLALFLFNAYDTLISLWKWYHWIQTGKLPLRFRFIREKLQKMAMDTSHIGLLTKNDLVDE